MDYTAITCPHCAEPNMAPIIYGFPTPELIELAKQDIVALGGNVPELGETRLTHYCYQCNETV